MTQTLELAAACLNAGRLDDAERFCRTILQLRPADPAALCILAGAANARTAHDRALQFLERALAGSPQWAPLLVEKAIACRGLGDRPGALAAAQRAVALEPANPNAYPVLAGILRTGEDYYGVIARFHQALKPRNYVEIGVDRGGSVTLAGPPTIVVGIDPEPRLLAPPRTVCKIVPLESDAYFAARDLRRDIEAETVHLAFLDGNHVFEQTLRDFIHIERFADPDTIVLVHDCLPVDALTAGRERKVNFWTGDVWKIVPCLRELRPDLEVFTIATPPSGLGVITSLDPRSTVLTDDFDAIVARYHSLEVGANEEARRERAAAIPNEWQKVLRRIRLP